MIIPHHCSIDQGHTARDEQMEKKLHIQKLTHNKPGVLPLMAAMPYSIDAHEFEVDQYAYDPASQLTVFAGHGGSRCSYDESAGGLFKSKTDTQKDD